MKPKSFGGKGYYVKSARKKKPSPVFSTFEQFYAFYETSNARYEIGRLPAYVKHKTGCDDETATQITSETWIAFYQKWRQSDVYGEIAKRTLYRIARNKKNDYLRRDYREQNKNERYAKQKPAFTIDGERVEIEPVREQNKRLADIINLSERQKAIIALGGFSVEVVARAIELSEKTVKREREKLRSQLLQSKPVRQHGTEYFYSREENQFLSPVESEVFKNLERAA